MKNLKKFVALLLAGVMAMVMLTACSGGSNAETKAKENKMIDSLKKQGVMTASENDNTLRKKTMDILNRSENFMMTRLQDIQNYSMICV